MDTMTSTEFRRRYATLTKPTVVTVNGHSIGMWAPVAALNQEAERILGGHGGQVTPISVLWRTRPDRRYAYALQQPPVQACSEGEVMSLAIDRFALSADHERQAQKIAADLARDPNLILGYLGSSVAIALERPRWANRHRLAIDLRVAQIVMGRSTEAETARREAARKKYGW